MPSFDVVSRTDLMEVDNVVNSAKREIKQRYDLAGTRCDVERSGDTLTLTADDNMKRTQVEELLKKYLVKRNVDPRALVFKEPETASGDTLRQTVTIKQGIDAELAKKISKAVKGTSLKVQVAIQQNELRVSGKSRDDLQATIKFIKDMELEQPLQYINFRE